MKLLTRLVILNLGLLPFAASAVETSINAGNLRVATDDQTGVISATVAGKEFLRDGKIGGVNLTKATRDGNVLRLTLADGRSAEVKVENDSPFVFIRCATVNTGTADADFNQQPALTATLDAGHDARKLKTMGTGGLFGLDRKPGSYMYLAIAEPQSRAGVVAGFVSCDRGSGVVLADNEAGKPHLEARVEYGRLRLKPGASEPGEWLAIGYFDDARLGLEAYAAAIKDFYKIKLPPQPVGYCTWYADKHGGACDETNLVVLAKYAAKELKPFGFDIVQIDDKWQAGISHDGPCREFMRARPDGPYPSGMKAAVGNITKLGLTPGIWFEPFAGTSYDPFFKDHQDWFYKNKDGKPFEAKWGGTCLDMSVPGARAYLKQLVHRIAHEWGYKAFKMDGLWTGTGTRLMYKNNGYKWDEMGEAAPADPSKTQMECFRDGLKLVREVAGSEVFLLGCCVAQNMRSFGGAFGLVDAMRVGPDTGAGKIGAPHASRNYFLQGRVWQNDPDCVSVRAKTPLDQARVNASFTAITGDLFYNSDWLPDLPAERMEILKRSMPAHNLPARPVDYFENDPARIWTVSNARQMTVGIFNWDATELAVDLPLERLGLSDNDEYVAFDFWTNTYIPAVKGRLQMTLPKNSCRVLSIRLATDHPQLISTSRHVTQGLVDVIEENWDAKSGTLSGKSRMVAGDPYELRIATPAGWKTDGATTVDGLTRVTITPQKSGEANWSVRFTK